jgi:TatD DNase family protein
MFIDVHCHLDMLDDPERAVRHARKLNVALIITQGINATTNEKTLSLSRKFPEVLAAVGLYPTEGVGLSKRELAEFCQWIRQQKKKVVAIGEVGLDLKELPDLSPQKDIFQSMIDISLELDKPLIVHSRKAELPCIEQLEASGARKVLMHCFSGKLSLAKRIVDNGWFLSIPTSVKNSEHFQNIIEQTPIEQLLCETDSPYLHPNREFPNEPANVIASYEAIAKIKGMKLNEVETQVEKNYKRLFE